MTPTRLAPTTAVLAGIGLIGIIVLLCLSKAVPADLWGLVLVLITGHLALSAPSVPTSATAVAPTPGAPTP
jgi:hypothetical protein